MRGWTIASLAALALLGCGADDSGGAVGAANDGAVLGCGDLLPFDGDCLAPPGEDVCGYVSLLGGRCVDADGDCYVERCDGLPEDYLAPIRDCDDRRPDAHGGALERCNGRDDDCDGRTDEGFDVGAPCEACGRAGKVECAVGGLEPTACSQVAGQSAAIPEDPLCNGEDDDCDGRIDEGCAAPLDAAEVTGLALCDDGLVYIADGVLRWQPEDGPAVDIDDAGPATPSCGAGHVAWLRLGEAGCDDTAGPPRCPFASLMISPLADPAPRDLTGPATLGGPQIGASAVFWYAIVEGTPTLRQAPLDGGSIEAPGGQLPLSDPTPADDALLARRWDGAWPSIVEVRDGATRSWPQPDAPAGAPAASARWVTWPVGVPGEAIWAAPRDGGPPLPLTDGPGPHEAPKLAGDRVVWRAGAALRAFDLATGEATTLAEAVGAFATDARRAVWVAEGPEGAALVQWWWAP